MAAKPASNPGGQGSADTAEEKPGRRDLRAARRRATMQRVQDVALDAFEARGFDRVSIEEIAGLAGVGPATIYRHFGTKERVVLWDEYDPELFRRLADKLEARDRAIADAALEALSDALATFYTAERARILRRTRLARATPVLAQAVAADLRGLRDALSALLREHRRAKDDLEARVAAGTLVAVLEAAIDHWLEQEGRLPLERCLKMAFARLGRLFG